MCAVLHIALITIRSENYFVMWKHQEIKDTTSPEHNDPEQLDSTPIHQNSNVTNTLPSKLWVWPSPKKNRNI